MRKFLEQYLDDVPEYDSDPIPSKHEGAIFPIVIVGVMTIVILGVIWTVAQILMHNRP